MQNPHVIERGTEGGGAEGGEGEGGGGAVWFWLKGFLMMSTRISQSASAALGNRPPPVLGGGTRE